MLVLTRKKDETIQIGDSIVIKVISTSRGKVKVGIEAPASLRVLRGELAEAIATHPDRLSSANHISETSINS